MNNKASFFKVFLFVTFGFYLVSCSKPEAVKPIVDDSVLLSQHLAANRLPQAKFLLPSINNSINSKNIIELYLVLREQGELALSNQVKYLKQFYPQMNFIHQSIYNQIAQRVYLKQIYRQEVSPPVRILQRDSLFLAPSNIDFKKCLNVQRTYCANEARAKLLEIITLEEITRNLKSMALKDPCVNLSYTLKGDVEANRCLKSSKGDLRIENLPKPLITSNQWLQAITND